MTTLRRGCPSSRPLAWGAGAALTYLALAWVSFLAGLLPVRPVFDGLAPPAPYRWVRPPPELRKGNQPPEKGAGFVQFAAAGSEPLTVQTGDGQAGVVLKRGAFAPREGFAGVQVTIAPLDPTGLPPPAGDLQVDGNAYRVEAAYVPSGGPANLALPGTLLLRYPAGATKILRLDGRRWAEQKTNVAAGTLTVFADVDDLGTFAAAGPRTAAPRETPWWAYLGSGAALAAVVGTILWRRRGSPGPPARGRKRP